MRSHYVIPARIEEILVERLPERIKNYSVLYLAFLIFSINSVFGKLASGYPMMSGGFLLYYGMELVGLCIYAVLWQIVLGQFKLSTAYAHRASVTLMSMMWGVLIFQEQLTWNMIFGAILIVTGIIVAVTKDD